MTRLTPVQMMWLGFGLLLVGWILPFLMVLRIVEPTLLLNFASFFASFIGLIVGLIGIVYHATGRKQ